MIERGKKKAKKKMKHPGSTGKKGRWEVEFEGSSGKGRGLQLLGKKIVREAHAERRAQFGRQSETAPRVGITGGWG